ncbi:MAG: serine--tRNA ligase, partial [Lewinella sp.]|nr:serine--tRNA ligase [Lewinella sp.]
MLETSFIRENRDRIIKGLATRNFPAEETKLVDQIIELDDDRKALQTNLDQFLAERNRLSGEIGQLFKSDKREEAESLRARVNELKEEAGG